MELTIYRRTFWNPVTPESIWLQSSVRNSVLITDVKLSISRLFIYLWRILTFNIFNSSFGASDIDIKKERASIDVIFSF